MWAIKTALIRTYFQGLVVRSELCNSHARFTEAVEWPHL